ncbi:MAG TPA: ATP-binding protein [Ramlibacter sp.]|nr:ATP-binding protein [Ramlibacter sp.]
MKIHDATLGPAPFGGHRTHVRWHWNVFPMGRLCSLRRALLLYLVPLFLIVGLASACFSYYSHGRMVNEFMDTQMEQLGLSLASRDGDIVAPPLTQDRIVKWGMYVVQAWDKDGNLLKSSWPQLAAPLQAHSGFADVLAGGQEWRVYTSEPGISGERVQVIQGGMFRRQLAVEQAVASIVPVLILLPLAIFILWSVARAMSVAMQDIGRQAESLDFNTLKELPLDRVPHELRPLVTSFNSLLRRLSDTFESKRRFVQDAAHELRTPLTALSLQLENLRTELPQGQCRASFGQLEGGVQRATRLVDQMLKMTRQEAVSPEAHRTVDLHAQVRESIGALIALADQRNIDLGVTGDGAVSAVTLRCPPNDLRSVLDNLIENALRYTPEGGVVDVHITAEDGKPAIEVVDTGPGIPPELISRVFDRFYRVPGSNVRGSGLGLAIAQAAAQRCGLRVILRNRTDRSGLIARLQLI